MTRPDEDVNGEQHGDLDLDAQQRGLEAPPDDAAEQSVPANPGEEPARAAEVPGRFEVGEWDALEQSIVIDLDDDEYDR